MRRERRALSVILVSFLLGTCAPGSAERPAADEEAAVGREADAAHRAEVEAWRAERLERLRAADGWLSLAGLHWLPEGRSSVGSQPMADVVLPASAPAQVGSLVRDGSSVTLEVAPGVPATRDGEPFRRLEMSADGDGEAPVVELGTLSFHVIERGERIGLRVRDTAASSRAEFTGIESFPVDRRWRVTARFEPYRPPRELEVEDYSGGTQDSISPGAVVFEIDGRSHRLDALDAGDELFLIFADQTSGRSTYGGGRYLYTDGPDPDGRVVIDFNTAYNPPCVFTPYATCPLPPPQNRLDLAVEAGEMSYPGPGAH